MAKLSQILRKLNPYADTSDFFAKGPESTLRGRNKHFSFLGLILSITIMIFLLVIFGYWFSELVNSTKPNVVKSDLPQVTTNDTINVLSRHSTLQMGFGLLDSLSGQVIPPEGVYFVDATIEIYDPVNHNWEGRKSLIIEPCSHVHFPDASPPDYSGLLCFAEQENLYVKTQFDTYIDIMFRRCTEQNQGNCRSNIDYILDNSQWYNYYTLWSVNPTEYENPLYKTYNVLSAGILAGVMRSIKMPVKAIEFNSDNGWMFHSTKSYQAMAFDQVEYDMNAFTETDAFLDVQVYNSGDKVIYDREYRKIQNICADLEGLATIMILVFGLLIFPYLSFSRLKMYEPTVNDLYRIKKNGANPQGATSVELAKSSDPSQTGQNDQYAPINVQDIVIHCPPSTSANQNASAPNQNARQHPQPEPNSKLNISCFEFIRSYFRPEPQVKLLSQAAEEIEGSVDHLVIIQKLLEVEKLKMCLLTVNQRILFNNLDKPTICLVEEQKKKEKAKIQEESESIPVIYERSSKEEKDKTPHQAYAELKGKESQTELDKQLVLLYEKAHSSL